MIFNASAQFHAQEVQKQIRPEIAAPGNHGVGEHQDLGSASDGSIQLGRRVPIGTDMKYSAACCAKKTISHMQGIIQPEPALVCAAKQRQKHGNFYGARSMKPSV